MKECLKGKKIIQIIMLIALSILIIVPILQVFLYSVFPAGGFDILSPIKVIKENNLGKTYINTITLGFYVVIFASIIAFPAAYIMAKTSLRRHKWIDIALLIPFMTPPYIGSMGWIMFLQPNGFLYQLLPASQELEKILFSLFGLVMVMGFNIFPFLYLMIKNALLNVSESLNEAAAISGAKSGRILMKITFPLIISAYVMGAMLVFVKAISEFGAPATFGSRIGFRVVTTDIHKYVSMWPIDFGSATSIASLLLITCLAFWYLQNVVSSKYTYATVGGKGIRSNHKKNGLVKGIFSYSYMVIVLLISVGIPYFSIIATSFIKIRGNGLQKGNFTLDHFKAVLSLGSTGMSAFTNSLIIALLTATICSLIGTIVAIIVVKQKGKISKVIDAISLMPNNVPAIVLVIGLILFWNASWNKLHVYNTIWMIIITYIVFFIPYSVQYVKSSLGQIDNNLLSAGEVCGASKLEVYMKIIVPLIAPGIVAGWAMTFTIAFRELVGALMVMPPYMKVISTYIYSQFEQGDAGQGMAMALISVIITTVILILVNVFSDKNKKEKFS